MNVSILNFNLFLKVPEVFIEQAVAHDLHMLEMQQDQNHLPI